MRGRQSFVTFVTIGALATALHYLILIILVPKMHAVAASSIGFAVSCVFNYYLNYRYTFRSQKSHFEVFPKFVAVACSGLVLNGTIMAIAIQWLELHYLLAQFASTGIVLFWNFFANLLWSFREQAASRET